MLIKILTFLCKGDMTDQIAKNQATCNKLGQMLAFAFRFDQIKMNNPNIQNDFSYYRRTVSKMKMGNAALAIPVSDELANRMSLFLAHSNPITKALIDGVKNQTQTVVFN